MHLDFDTEKKKYTPHLDASRVHAPIHLDANETAFFQLQLTYIEVQQKEILHKPLRAAQFIPVTSEAPSGAESIQIRYFDLYGKAKIVADFATDFPSATTAGSFKTFQVKSLGSSFSYTVPEIRRAQMAGLPLSQREAMAAEIAINEMIDTIAWLGDSGSNLYGLLNYPGILTYSLPATGTGSKTLWSTKTPDQIVADVNGLISAVRVATNGRHIPDTILVPQVTYLYLNATRLGSYNDKTLLQYLQDTLARVGVTEIGWINESVGIGSAGDIPAGQSASNRIIAYVRDPNIVKLEIPQPFEMFPPQLEGLTYKVHCHARTAGVICYYPWSIAVADGV